MSLTYRDTKGTPLTSAEGDANIRTLKAGLDAVTVSATGGKNAGKLSCLQRQRSTVSAGWSTIAETSSGTSGVITSIWIANASAGLDASKMRLSVDQEVVPSLFGSNGATLAEWFCQGNGVRQNYRTDLRGVTKNGSGGNGNGFSGYLKFDIPFSDGFKLEYNPSVANEQIWLMLEYSDSFGAFDLPADYRAKASVTTATLAYKDVLPFLNTANDTVLAGFYAFLSSSANQYYNEGDIRAFYNQETTASYRSSGFEDIFDSSYYFEEGTFQKNYAGVVSKTVGGSNPQTSYKFWPLLAGLRADSGLKLTYTCGDPDYPDYPAGSTNAEFVAWYYERPVGSGIGSGVTTLAKPPLTLTPADSKLTATTGTVANATSYEKQYDTASNFSNPTAVDDSSTVVNDILGLTNGTPYYVRVRAKSSNAAYATSGWTVAVGTPQVSISPDAFFNLDPAIGVVTDNGRVTQITDTIGAVVFGLDPNLPGPSFVSESPDFNNLPALYFTNANNTGPVLVALNSVLAHKDTFTMYAVVSGEGTLFTNRVFPSSNSNAQTYYSLKSSAIEAGGGAVANFSHNNPQIVCYVVSPASVTVYNSANQSIGSFAPPTLQGAANVGVAIGASRLTDDYWLNFSAMTLAGLYGFPAARTSAQRVSDFGFLKSKFGL